MPAMADKPPFDAVRYCFWLIACLLAVQCFAFLMGLGWCMWVGAAIVEGRFTCERLGSQLTELLTMGLAAALAFAGGLTGKDK
jgi:hypothetical protein